jgi:xanthine dehydrogenase YagR molybdenum-binding subunit
MGPFFGMESAMDELAWKLGMIPVESCAATTPGSTRPSAFRSFPRLWMESYDAVAEGFGWADQQGGRRIDGDWMVGCATATHPTNIPPPMRGVRDAGTARPMSNWPRTT